MLLDGDVRNNSEKNNKTNIEGDKSIMKRKEPFNISP